MNEVRFWQVAHACDKLATRAVSSSCHSPSTLHGAICQFNGPPRTPLSNLGFRCISMAFCLMHAFGPNASECIGQRFFEEAWPLWVVPLWKHRFIGALHHQLASHRRLGRLHGQRLQVKEGLLSKRLTACLFGKNRISLCGKYGRLRGGF